MTQDERKVIELAQEGVEIHAPNSPEYIVCAALIEALEQPEQKEQLLFEIDGEMLTASQTIGVELFNFQQATGCNTADEFLSQPEQEYGVVAGVGKGVEIPAGVKYYYIEPKLPPQRTWVGLTDEQMQFLATAIGQAKQIIDTYNTEFVTARDDLRRCSELLAAHNIKE